MTITLKLPSQPSQYQRTFEDIRSAQISQVVDRKLDIDHYYASINTGTIVAPGDKGDITVNTDGTWTINVIDSIADLRALTVATYPGLVAVVESWVSGSHKGGGTFLQNVGSVAGDDGGMTFIDADSRRWTRVWEGMPSGVMWGMTADGAYNGLTGTTAGYTGTDNAPMLNLALTWCNTNNRALFVPGGNYSFARPTTYSDFYTLNMPNGANWSILGERDKTVFLMDENCAVTQATNSFIGGTGTTGKLVLLNIELCGLWQYSPYAPDENTGARGEAGITFLNGLDEFISIGCKYTDQRSQATNIHLCKFGRFLDNRITRAARAGIRFVNSLDVQILYNTLIDVDDDAIAYSSDDEAGEGMPVASRCLIGFNILENSEGIVAYGGHTCIIGENILDRCHGSGITVSPANTTVGNSSSGIIAICKNTIRNQVKRYNPVDGWHSGTFASWIDVGGSCLVASPTSGAFPDAWDGVAYQPSYAKMDVAAPWGAENVVDWYNAGGDATVYANAGTRHIIVSENLLVRNLPDTSAWFNWKYDYYMNRAGTAVGAAHPPPAGYYNPSVDITSFKEVGIRLLSDMYGCTVCNNDIDGMPKAGIFFQLGGKSTLTDKQFDNIKVHGNRIRNCGNQGISTQYRSSGTTDRYTWGIEISNNFIDVDPNFLNVDRKSPPDGSWVTPAASLDTRADAINLKAIKGCSILNNTMRNCYSPIIANADIYSQHFIRGNILECDPDVDGFAVTNKGIGTIEPSGPAFTYKIYNCDPTSGASYKILSNICPLEATAMPTTGKFVRGHYVTLDPAVVSVGATLLGFLRLTTGSAHVLDTDWKAIYSTDYASANFTPVVVGTTTAGVGTYGSQKGRYTKIGNRVFFSINIVWTAHTGTGNMFISGLPFTSNNIAGDISTTGMSYSNLTFAANPHAYIPINSTTILFFTSATGAAEVALPLDTAATLRVSGSYEI